MMRSPAIVAVEPHECYAAPRRNGRPRSPPHAMTEGASCSREMRPLVQKNAAVRDRMLADNQSENMPSEVAQSANPPTEQLRSRGALANWDRHRAFRRGRCANSE